MTDREWKEQVQMILDSHRAIINKQFELLKTHTEAIRNLNKLLQIQSNSADGRLTQLEEERTNSYSEALRNRGEIREINDRLETLEGAIDEMGGLV